MLLDNLLITLVRLEFTMDLILASTRQIFG